ADRVPLFQELRLGERWCRDRALAVAAATPGSDHHERQRRRQHHSSGQRAAHRNLLGRWSLPSRHPNSLWFTAFGWGSIGCVNRVALAATTTRPVSWAADAR